MLAGHEIAKRDRAAVAHFVAMQEMTQRWRACAVELERLRLQQRWEIWSLNLRNEAQTLDHRKLALWIRSR